jgi:hypothetical protein
VNAWRDRCQSVSEGFDESPGWVQNCLFILLAMGVEPGFIIILAEL